jgi:hypothetical protein
MKITRKYEKKENTEPWMYFNISAYFSIYRRISMYFNVFHDLSMYLNVYQYINLSHKNNEYPKTIKKEYA